MHIITCETGTSVGAFSPRHNRRRSLAWNKKTCFVKLWRLMMTKEYVYQVTTRSINAEKQSVHTSPEQLLNADPLVCSVTVRLRV